jgi:hypothetical protein
MALQGKPNSDFPSLIEVIKSFRLVREVSHCGTAFDVSPFDFYANCPQCGCRIKVRSFSTAQEVEDVFDAVFAWIDRPGAEELMRRRQQAIREDAED